MHPIGFPGCLFHRSGGAWCSTQGSRRSGRRSSLEACAGRQWWLPAGGATSRRRQLRRRCAARRQSPCRMAASSDMVARALRARMADGSMPRVGGGNAWLGPTAMRAIAGGGQSWWPYGTGGVVAGERASKCRRAGRVLVCGPRLQARICTLLPCSHFISPSPPLGCTQSVHFLVITRDCNMHASSSH